MSTRVVCVFRDDEDYTRTVTDWLEDFYRQTGREIETINPDEEPDFCRLYDVVEYPSILALGANGEVRAAWRGKAMPLINEVLYYMM